MLSLTIRGEWDGIVNKVVGKPNAWLENRIRVATVQGFIAGGSVFVGRYCHRSAMGDFAGEGYVSI